MQRETRLQNNRLARFLNFFSRKFHSKRMEFFRRVFRPAPETTILDVGGTDYCWRLSGIRCKLTLCNLDPEMSVDGYCEHIVGDGLALPFPDKSFDIVFSNSTIEHVGDFEQQTQFAREIRRVGRSYWVQTPNRRFPIEPHYLLPFVQYLPFWLRWRAKYLSPHHLVMMRLPTREEALQVATEVRLITAPEMRTFFPDGELHREKLCGLTKSLVSYKVSLPAVTVGDPSIREVFSIERN